MQTLDTTGVEPTAHVAGLDTVLRDDEPSDSLPAEDTLLNALAAARTSSRFAPS